jgi:dihydroflavonol-4-reductase
VTILVTGATGFIGSHLCRALVEHGEAVRAFHRPSSQLVGLEGLPVEHALGDITQPETLEAALHGVQTVFHTAAYLGPARDLDYAYGVTVGGTRTLLAAAQHAGVERVIHTSSVAALGVPIHTPASPDPALNRGMDETHTWNFPPHLWPYGHAKYLAEMEVQHAVARGLDAVIVNPAVVVGPGDLNRVSGEIILQVARGRVPVSIPGGLNVIHIADVVRGHLVAWKQGRTGERYILGHENLTHRAFLELVASVTGARPPRIFLPARPVRWLARPVTFLARWLPLPIAGEALHKAGYHFYYDTRKARSQLGLDQLLSARQGIEEAYVWYKERQIIGSH